MKVHKKIKNIIVGGLLLSLLNGCGTAGQAENVVGNTNLNLLNMGIAAEQGNKIFYADRGTLYSADLDGENPKELAKCDAFAPNLNVVGDWIYYFSKEGSYEENNVKNGIYKVRTNGKDEQKIIDVENWYTSLVSDGKNVYYFDSAGLYKVSVDGGEKIQLLSDLRPHLDIMERRVYLSEDGTKLYCYCELEGAEDNEEFYVLNVDGTGLQSLKKLLPDYDWMHHWNNHQFGSITPIDDERIMLGDDCIDWTGKKVFGVNRWYFNWFNIYKDYLVYIDENEFNHDAVFLLDTETWEEAEVIDIVQKYSVDGASDEIGCAGTVMLFYTEVELPPEIIDGVEVYPVKSEPIILGEADFEEAIKELQQRAEILEKEE